MLPFMDEIYRGHHGSGCMCDECLESVDARLDAELSRA